MKKLSIGLTSAVLFSASFALAGESDSLATQQKSLLEKLDSLNAAVLGLKVNGSAKAGVLASFASSDQFSDNSPTQENQAYTDVNLILTARPSSETEVRVEARLHKDWQSAFDENNNPVIGHWFSYDGLILNKHVAFNLGYMRVGFTPYTLHSEQPHFLQEAEIFAESRVEALAKRNLDTTSRRLLQGLNVEYKSGAVGVFDDIQAQVTGARLRGFAKKNDQVFFDFDWSDRYMYGGRLAAEAYGARLGVNYVSVFDRRLTTFSHDLGLKDTVIFDDNNVFSAELGFNSSKLLPDLPIEFGLTGELAMSWWNADKYYIQKKMESSHIVSAGPVVVDPEAGIMDSIGYVSILNKSSNATVTEKYADDNGMGFYVEPYIKGNFGKLDLNLKASYLSNDEEFWSEMASVPSYRGGSVILNANGLYSDSVYSELVSVFGMSSLENLYFQVYNSNPLNVTNIMSPADANALTEGLEAANMYSRVYNNYKNAHFYRNGYNADTKKRLEAAEAVLLMDPSINMALPYGLATPDRKGFAAAFDASWDEAAELNVRFALYNQDAIDNQYTEYGVGLGVDIGHLLGWERKLLVQGAFEHGEEDAFYKRKSDRISAGASLDIWGPISFLAGFQSVTKEYGNALWVTSSAAITEAEEMLVRVGPRIKIAPASYISLQYGMLTDKVSFTRTAVDELGTPTFANDEFSIDKNVIMADVTVTF